MRQTTLTYTRTSDGRLVAIKPRVEFAIKSVPGFGEITTTNFRITHAFLNGANTDRVVDMLRRGEEVRALYRAAMLCESSTPRAYYAAWPEMAIVPKLTGFEEETRRGAKHDVGTRLRAY